MISGLQKMTLLDFPGRVACTVFLQGCNFRCPFCHNTGLLPRQGEQMMATEDLLKFLRSRTGLLDGVCLTGGEPTLQDDLPALIRSIRALGYKVKLDTNGSRPQMLKVLTEEGLVDYVAMDVKNAPSRYGEIIGLKKVDMASMEESLRHLIGGTVDYEVRTTLVAQFHDEEAVREMGQWLGALVPGKKPKIWYLQTFVDRDSVEFSGLTAPETAQTEAFRAILEPFAEKVVIRNP